MTISNAGGTLTTLSAIGISTAECKHYFQVLGNYWNCSCSILHKPISMTSAINVVDARYIQGPCQNYLKILLNRVELLLFKPTFQSPHVEICEIRSPYVACFDQDPNQI
uniref:Uncharacterized protein n=1 Tax=Romanomermis culicivorax TaxID=13658 RepID=A0A915HQ53_ROMCU